MMLNTNTIRCILNPILGFLFFGLYVVLHAISVPEPIALVIPVVLAFTVLLVLAKVFNIRLYTLSLTTLISVVAIVSVGVLWGMGNRWITKSHTYVFIGEMIIILLLMIVHLLKRFLKARLIKKRVKSIDRFFIEDLFFTTITLQYALTIHVFFVVAYKQITDGFYCFAIDKMLYEIVPILILLIFYIQNCRRALAITKRLLNEEWLPIVTEEGSVTGRIAKAVSVNMRNKFLHPVVRIALVSNGKVFLQERRGDMVVDSGKLDHLFEKYILYKHDVDLAVKNSIKRIVGAELGEKPKFLLKYIFENEKTKRLIFLYLIEIDDESKIKRKGKITGKFWTVRQIDEEFENQIFSEEFELEYEYLKHVILLGDADELMSHPDGYDK